MQSLFVLGVLLTLLCSTYAQDILSVLATEQNVAQFTTFLTQNTNLTQQINQGVYTVVVPTDNAIDTFKAQNAAAFADNSSFAALLGYHVLQNTHTSASFTNQSVLVPTLLTNTSYTNVTGGQRVELILQNGKPTFLSAVKAPSTIVTPDIFFTGGIIQIVDTVLTIPLSFAATITKANLSYLTALLAKGGFLDANSVAITLATETPDLTIFAPNNPAYGESYTGWDGLSQSQLDDLFQYHVIPSVVYTQSMHNNSQYQTLANVSVTTTTYGNPNIATNPDLFVDQAQITGYNYLTANGVFQIINQPLNLNTPDARPNATQIASFLETSGQTTNSPKKLSGGVIGGIVVGAVLVPATIFITAFFLLRRQKWKRSRLDNATEKSELPDYSQAVSEADSGIPSITIESHERPSSVARSVNSLRGTVWPRHQTTRNQTAVIELDGKGKEFDVYEIGLAHSPEDSPVISPATTRRVPTPPELDGIERATSQRSISIHFNGRQPRHIGFQAQY